ncbi:pentapeptide repeat-containing protein [Flavobacterium sp. UBA6031]|uniref:pentapeptide repeat-containing protein n=1 Tax=Flavobacterium sp. UBA6031 TaxID=1946551 RepID=UPI0025BB6F86|nr:pentapeptide repeat-containing protein [Flavobacterium sp. UBA6031]
MIEDKLFDRLDYTVTKLPRGEYENCRFLNCNFYNGDLSHMTFRECIFDSCDFSLAKLKNTAMNDIHFVDCKLLGVQFEECNPFLLSFYFENCVLKLTVFNKLKLKRTRFKNCNMQETDFTETDLNGSVFDNCDLLRAIFHKTNLEKADFLTSFNYSIDPEQNRIKKARFSRMGIIGLLDKYGIEIE